MCWSRIFLPTDLKKNFAAFAMANTSVVPMFSASQATQFTPKNRVTFQRLSFTSNDFQGSFNQRTGVFTVPTSGVYLLNFNGMCETSEVGEVFLRVNGNIVEKSACYVKGSPQIYGTLVISTLLKLNKGDCIDIFLFTGSLYEKNGGLFNRFWVSLLSHWKTAKAESWNYYKAFFFLID